MTENREYTVVTSDGEVVRHGKAEVLPEPPQGCLRLIGVLPPNAPSYWDGEVFILKPPPPSAHHIFDYTTKQWVDPRTLQDLKDLAHAKIESWRNKQEAVEFVFEHAGHQWDGGLVVRQRMQPVLGLPTLPEGFFWTDALNNDVPMDMASLQLLASAHEQALVVRGFQIHARQRAMKESLGTMTRQQLLDFTPGWEDPVLIPEQPKDS